MYIFGHEKLVDEMLTDFNSVCNSLDIPWWITAGVALGFYRDGGYIPWDSDIDVGIICTDDEYTEIFKRLFDLYGFMKFYDVSTGKKFRCGIGHAYKKGGKTHQDSLFLDIMRIGVEPIRCITPKFFEVTTWFECRGMGIRIPHPIEDYLLFMYGDTWRTPQPKLKQWDYFINKASPEAQAQVKEMLNATR